MWRVHSLTPPPQKKNTIMITTNEQINKQPKTNLAIRQISAQRTKSHLKSNVLNQSILKMKIYKILRLYQMENIHDCTLIAEVFRNKFSSF